MSAASESGDLWDVFGRIATGPDRIARENPGYDGVTDLRQRAEAMQMTHLYNFRN